MQQQQQAPPEPARQQGTVLAVHTSQLTRDGVAQLAREGYGILPDQSGWLVFVRVPEQGAGDGRQATDGPAGAPPTTSPDERAPESAG